jgi:hypothetical protein
MYIYTYINTHKTYFWKGKRPEEFKMEEGNKEEEIG